MSGKRNTLTGFLLLLSGLAGPLPADELYGQVWLRNYDTNTERRVDRACKIVVRTDKQTFQTVTGPGGRYHLNVAEEGNWTVYVHYRDLVLSTDIRSFWSPNRIDLFIETKDGQYRLNRTLIREYRVPAHP